MRFLLVEDNEELGEAVIARLSLDGHAVDHAMTLAEAEEWLAIADYDLMLLDVMLPDGDGREFLRKTRTVERLPVIVLTARSQVSDRVDTLDMGADDYITKPFDFGELEARCRAVLRRRGTPTPALIPLGTALFDPSGGTLQQNGDTKPLRNRELRLLEVFARNKGQILSKTQLLDRLFSQDAEVSENAIEVYVGRLRKRLQEAGVEIETVRGIGYRMTWP
ncbi:winged helix family two component transcriptional regulator [Loktanella sp. PT4BL]|jgi:two-component system response regulator TctD|uniref:response regulator transcription factor n=1 Tax=Rhodobacterales TaxID=204455 RepID=UPI000D76EB53|nr:response regulator transcription factor [Loktanella sp. PT4BL]PXW70465.1 winged helix family two component transcriptional regulator [Loktanella sp. PT4BL]